MLSLAMAVIFSAVTLFTYIKADKDLKAGKKSIFTTRSWGIPYHVCAYSIGATLVMGFSGFGAIVSVLSFISSN